ncbi:hypothetical protein [Nonomuraea sp. 10N515B]|uniref:hypothetical protein n=1 Tax=Nonomuraea sp. 10N515B TaxID=3457422 RepID=UPI003FCE2FA1
MVTERQQCVAHRAAEVPLEALMRHARSQTWAIIIVSILAASVAYGMFSFVARPSADPCPEASNGAPRENSIYADRAAPYQGKGPHPVLLVKRGGTYPTEEWTDPLPQDDILPDDWEPPNGDRSKVQLVVCQYEAEKLGVVGECSFTHPQYVKVPLVAASYTFLVYEARTARPVTTFKAKGYSQCPGSTVMINGNVGEIVQEVSQYELAGALRAYVEGTV